MRGVAAIAAAAMALCIAPAVAQPLPRIPPSEMPGRERERFFDRFPQQERLREDPGLARPGKARPAPKERCRTKGTKRRKGC